MAAIPPDRVRTRSRRSAPRPPRQPRCPADAAAHRPAHEDVKAQGVRDGIAGHPGKTRKAHRHLSGPHPPRRQDVMERHRREADRGEGQRGQKRGGRGFRDRRQDVVQVHLPADPMDNHESKDHRRRTDQRPDHPSLERPTGAAQGVRPRGRLLAIGRGHRRHACRDLQRSMRRAAGRGQRRNGDSKPPPRHRRSGMRALGAAQVRRHLPPIPELTASAIRTAL